ncbi:MAG: TlpA disulfide reductase family protein [Capsulimonadaceae bacterium]|nr:TlpA disulfide reductase family protein [Capsulimonadaceae bacterium]
MFDRSAITPGRTIQEFGLCDLKGVYQNTTRLRSKGWLVVFFFKVDDEYSASVAATLGGWAAELPADRVSLLGVASGDRTALTNAAASLDIKFPVVWDPEDYVAGTWGINALPAVFVSDARGKVLARIAGDDQPALEAAKSSLSESVRKAIEAAAKAAEEAAKAAAPAAVTPPAPAPPISTAPVPAPSTNPAAAGSAVKEPKKRANKKKE